ncbi:MAG: electron transfer flavoprotein subunit alpha/FixB family protein [Calditrichaeota bacterium]|nr:MAG: electron transfer flavoprotein subunit alpha/FixB family protein [Calditrichota bacterium]MBL1205662.1 electron transfer flavoprotein subunit alpha/FixB family protein [Calditrichota bacterium]NOG45490.1 electron transfer flavoprotein subunit alpha/FixB family protein [Calditrichota bacterium]
MKALVFAEHKDGKLRKIAFENVSLVKKLGLDFECAIIGNDVDAEELGKYGAEKVAHYKSDKLADYSPDGYAKVLADAMDKQGADVLFLGATAMGKDLAPRVAARVNGAMATDCTQVEMDGDNLKIVRPMYAGKVQATIKLTSAKKIVTVRPNVYAAEENAASASVETVASDVDFNTVVKEIISGAQGKLDVTEADIVVSGGRGMKGPENWHLIEDLASALGAANGASRAAVDAGWRPHDEQVGQTGKTVAPSLYVAVGISGAIQHLAGMSSSKYIVAINKDPEAPIFKVADYGIVADLFDVVPKMIEEVKAKA